MHDDHLTPLIVLRLRAAADQIEAGAQGFVAHERDFPRLCRTVVHSVSIRLTDPEQTKVTIEWQEPAP